MKTLLGAAIGSTVINVSGAILAGVTLASCLNPIVIGACAVVGAIAAHCIPTDNTPQLYVINGGLA